VNVMDPVRVAVLVPVLFSIRFLLFKFLFHPLGKYCNIKEDKELKKFSESGLKILYYLPMWIWGYTICRQYHLIEDTKNCWRGFPNQPFSDGLVYFYTLQLSFYIYTQISHTLIDVPRKDYFPLLTHHFLTIFLILYSFNNGYFRVGMLVFYTMDLVDVFLENTKFFNYLKLDLITNSAFVAVLFGWVYFRIIQFPYLVIWSIYSESVQVHIEEGFTEYNITIWYVALVVLSLLEILQLYWFALIVNVLRKMLRTGKLHDVTDKEHLERESKGKKETPDQLRLRKNTPVQGELGTNQ